MATQTAGRGTTGRAQGKSVGSVGGILRLLSGGATEAILLALGEGPLQTKVLTHRVRGYTPRTVYRYLPKLARLGLVERSGEPSGSSKVVNTLTAEAGSDMCGVVERFARASMTRLPGEQVELSTWGSLGLLADLWEAGVVEALSRGPRSPTELVQRQRGLSYHQVNRKVGQFKKAGFLRESQRAADRQRSYALTEKARRTMALVADVGRWRGRHLPDFAEEGLTPEEVATIVRAVLPLATLAPHAGKGLGVRVDGPEDAEAWVRVDEEGEIHPAEEPPEPVAAGVAGDVGAWLAALLDGDGQLTVDGDAALAADCLSGVYEMLWTPSPF